MARRRLAYRIILAASPSLLMLLGLGVWIALRSPADFTMRNRDDAEGRGGLEEPLSPSSSPVPERSRGLSGELLHHNEGEHSIIGTVLTPSGRAAVGAEVVLVTLAAADDPGLDDDPGDSLGEVRDPDGLTTLERLARDFERELGRSPRVSASPEGRFEFSGIESGTFRVVARSDGLLPDVSDVVVVDAARTSGSVDLKLKESESISGVILSPERSPVEGARVEARGTTVAGQLFTPLRASRDELFEIILSQRSGTSHTDATGRFDITGLLGGYYDLEISASGFARSVIADAPARKDLLEIVLQPGLFLGGEVLDREAKPVVAAEVRLTFLAADASDLNAILPGVGPDSRDQRAAGALHRARTDGDGRFTIGGLPRGTYRAEVDHPGHLRAIVPLITVHESSTDEERHLIFELEEGHRIGGVVRTESEKPLAGARVHARFRRPLAPPDETGGGQGLPSRIDAGSARDQPATGSRSWSVGTRIEELTRRRRRVHSTVTGADGSFGFASLPEGIYQLDISAKSHSPRTLEEVVTDNEPVEIDLAPGTALEGRVVDSHSGTPVPRALVGCYSVREAPYAGSVPSRGVDERKGTTARAEEVRTDTEGRFRIDDLARGDPITIRVEAVGYRALEVELGDSDRDEVRTLELERTGSVSGRVRAGSGLPVEGLRVGLMTVSLVGEHGPPVEGTEDERTAGRAASWRPSRRVGESSYTDADGLYRVFVSEAGSYRVVVDGRPYAPSSSRVLAIPDARARIRDVDIPLQLAATVRGLVVARDMHRVAGARVRVLPLPSPDDAGTPIDEPAWRGSSRGPEDEREARTDATGEFEVEGLAGGSYRIVASAPGFIRSRSESFELTSGSLHVVEIELEPEMTIAGRIVSADAESVSGADIRAVLADGASQREFWSEERTISSALGTFRLSRLANRPYDLRVTADGFASSLLRGVPAGSKDVLVRLERPVSLSGKVLGAYTEEPVEEYRLRLEFKDEERLSRRERTSVDRWRKFSDPDGAFVVEGLPPGRYVVEIDAPRHLPADVLELDLPVDEGVEGLVIHVSEVGVIAGAVFDSFSEPIPGARVEALEQWIDPVRGTISYRPLRSFSRRSQAGSRGPEESGRRGERRGAGRERGDRDRSEPPGRTKTKHDGSFVLRDLPDGAYRLTISHDDYVPRDLGDYVLENGQGSDATVAVRAFLASGATLLGRVRGLEEYDGGGTVYLYPVRRGPDSRSGRGSRRKSARVDRSGRFEIRGLETGEYMLFARFRRTDGRVASMRKTVRIHDAHREKGILLELSR